MTPGRSLLPKTIMRSIAPVAQITWPARTRQLRSSTLGFSGARSLTMRKLCSRYAHTVAFCRCVTLGIAASSATTPATHSIAGASAITRLRFSRLPPASDPSSAIMTRKPARPAARAADRPAGPAPAISTSQWAKRFSKWPDLGGD